MAVDDGNSTVTRLLTLLNVSATKPGKRKHLSDDSLPTEKSRKRKTIKFADESTHLELVEKEIEQPTVIVDDRSEGIQQIEEIVEVEGSSIEDSYEKHFGSSSLSLTQSSRDAVDRKAWKLTRTKGGQLGAMVELVPEGSLITNNTQRNAILERLRTPFENRQAKLPREIFEVQNDLLMTLSTHRDLYLSSISLEERKSAREVIALHALNHVTKKRRKVLKNNERLSHAVKTIPTSAPPEDVQDQGFTRPSVLFLLPLRSSALRWFETLTSHTPPPTYQIENHSRFLNEYGLPEGTVDKLETTELGTYPEDHIEMFKGNADDNFRVGVKLTRKSVKLFADFYGCDIIFASPLGLRMSIEKEKNADFLSSIEILVVDQMDALTMQNWEHVQFVFSNLNTIPKESHDTDFSRIKPWYLEGHASYLRQTILMSAYETPETRALFNNSLKNVAGKIRTEKRWKPVQVPEGVEQQFIHFDCVGPADEADKRFNYFTTQLLPAILKSAVQSASAVVFIPSSFDFIRVHNYFKKHAGVTFTVLSEYSTNQEISRARQAFFTGKKSFLLISERFQFYRRYKIRGIRNLFFYGPPDHPQFYREMLSYPFLDDGVEVVDVSCRVLFSKYDWFRLERLAGTDGALELIKGI